MRTITNANNKINLSEMIINVCTSDTVFDTHSTHQKKKRHCHYLFRQINGSIHHQHHYYPEIQNAEVNDRNSYTTRMKTSRNHQKLVN